MSLTQMSIRIGSPGSDSRSRYPLTVRTNCGSATMPLVQPTPWPPTAQASMGPPMTDNTEQDDIAEASSQCCAFNDRMDKLFGSSEMCFKTPGFTKTMVDVLSKPMVWVVKDKRSSIGSEYGPSHGLKQSCLARMRCWLKLCASTIQAEFPDFALVQVLAKTSLKI